MKLSALSSRLSALRENEVNEGVPESLELRAESWTLA
jgi:hypothetical protein